MTRRASRRFRATIQGDDDPYAVVTSAKNEVTRQQWNERTGFRPAQRQRDKERQGVSPLAGPSFMLFAMKPNEDNDVEIGT